MVEPRPRSKISRSSPASIRVEALKLDSRGVGVPVPSRVTFISAASADHDHRVATKRSIKLGLKRIGRFPSNPRHIAGVVDALSLCDLNSHANRACRAGIVPVKTGRPRRKLTLH